MHRSLDAHRLPESRAIADDDELRRCPPNSAQFWGLGTYGLGSETRTCPASLCCVRMVCRHRKPELEIGVSSRFLPATQIDTRETQIESLSKTYATVRYVRRTARELDLLANAQPCHQESRSDDALLEARVQSFELAYRMQMEADDAFDLSREPEHVWKLYATRIQGRQMMIARRLLERGVRFVQVLARRRSTLGQPHDIRSNHGRLAREMRSADRGAAQGSEAAWHAGGYPVIWVANLAALDSRKLLFRRHAASTFTACMRPRKSGSSTVECGKFATPDHQGILQHATLLQILEQRRDR